MEGPIPKVRARAGSSRDEKTERLLRPSRAPHRVAVLGGTFDRLHAGHRALLAAAFESAREVGVGLTSDRFLRAHPKPLGAHIRSYRIRRKELIEYLNREYPRRRWWVVPLHDPWGRAVVGGVDLLVVSEETRSAVPAIQRERRRGGLPPLALRIVRTVRAADGRPIASRRIRAGEIDTEGRPLIRSSAHACCRR